MFSGAQTHLGPPEGFLSNAETVALKFLTQSSLQFFSQKQSRVCSAGNSIGNYFLRVWLQILR